MNYKDIGSKIKDIDKSSEKAVTNSIGNVIATPIGSMPGHPEFGCNMGQFLFEQINPLSIALIKEEIKYSLKRWEPRIIVTKIDVIEDNDYLRLLIKIHFTILADPTSSEREYIYKVQTN